MMRLDALVDAYRGAEIGRRELFGWLTEYLMGNPERLALALAALDFDAKLRREFAAWLDHLKERPEILHHGEVLTPSEDLLTTLAGPVPVPPHDALDLRKAGFVELNNLSVLANVKRSPFVGTVRRGGTPGDDVLWTALVAPIVRDVVGSARVVGAMITPLSRDAEPLRRGEQVEVSPKSSDPKARSVS